MTVASVRSNHSQNERHACQHHARLASGSMQFRHGRSCFQLEQRWQKILCPRRHVCYGVPTHHFQGVRLALFNYNTTGKPGGYADFDNFTVEEPRARGIERMIPIGKIITLSSGADGSILAVDDQNQFAGQCAGQFHEIRLRKRCNSKSLTWATGRVALKTVNGRFVSVGDEGVSLKELAGKSLGDAESFQWINLMRGDTMLMSLVNHRHLTTSPNNPGPVMISATSPRPDRKEGACFKWKEVQ